MGVYFDFYGTKAHFNPHESVSSMFGALLTAVYALFEEEHDSPHCADNAVVKNVEFTIELEWFGCYNRCIGSA